MGIFNKLFGNTPSCVESSSSMDNERRWAQSRKNQEILEEIEVELGLYGLYGDQIPKDQMRLCSLIRRIKDSLYI